LQQLAPAEKQLPCMLPLPGILDRCSKAFLQHQQQRSLPGSVSVGGLHTVLKDVTTAAAAAAVD